MNTYNDNLRDSIVTSLLDIEKHLKSARAKRSTSMFSLYYAEGARITANEKLALDQKKYTDLSAINVKAVSNQNLALNLLSTAQVEKELVAKSVSDTAVSAANVQIASNAILKLSSDIGSMLSIASAADYDSKIHKEIQYAKNVMDQTAFSAEDVSKKAMQASALTAKISAGKVEEKATVMDAVIKTLLEKLSGNLTSANENMVASGATLDEVTVVEKKAESDLEDANAEHESVLRSFNKNRKDLNLNLRVDVNTGPANRKPKENSVKQEHNEHLSGDNVAGVVMTADGEPINDAIVRKKGKEKGKITNEKGEFHYRNLNLPRTLIISCDGYQSLEFEATKNNIEVKLSKDEENNESALTDDQFRVSFDHFESPFPEPIEKKESRRNNTETGIHVKYPADSYQLFIVENNKKSTFSIVSAESIDIEDSHKRHDLSLSNSESGEEGPIAEVLNLSETLDADGEELEMGKEYVVFVKAILSNTYKNIVNNYEDYLSAPSAPFKLTNKLAPANTNFKCENKEFKFAVEGYQSNVEYRCMFLPANVSDSSGMLTLNELNTLESKITSAVDLQVKNAIILVHKSAVKHLQTRLRIEQRKTEKLSGEKKIQKEKDIESITEKLNTNKELLEKAIENKENNSLDVESASEMVSKLGFVFNQMLAEQVLTGNYISVKPKKDEKELSCPIGAETTDNFGNRLMAGTNYLPVVLTMSTVNEESKSMYQNAMTDINQTKVLECKDSEEGLMLVH